jgi:ribosome-associated protein
MERGLDPGPARAVHINMPQTARIIQLCKRELAFDLVRASGPGGENVNKVSTAVQLRFNIRASPSIDADTKNRLIKHAAKRVTPGGVLVIQAKSYRTQTRNREEALSRFERLIERALVPPKARRPTRATAASKTRRLQAKKHRSEVKRSRGRLIDE